MTETTDWADIKWACPRCDGPLAPIPTESRRVVCRDCQREYDVALRPRMQTGDAPRAKSSTEMLGELDADLYGDSNGE